MHFPRVDRYMAAAGLDDLTTVAQAHYNPCDATLTFALAGHPLPLVIHANGEIAFLEADFMPPLGGGLTVYANGCHDHSVRLAPRRRRGALHRWAHRAPRHLSR